MVVKLVCGACSQQDRQLRCSQVTRKVDAGNKAALWCEGRGHCLGGLTLCGMEGGRGEERDRTKKMQRDCSQLSCDCRGWTLISRYKYCACVKLAVSFPFQQVTAIYSLIQSLVLLTWLHWMKSPKTLLSWHHRWMISPRRLRCSPPLRVKTHWSPRALGTDTTGEGRRSGDRKRGS